MVFLVTTTEKCQLFLQLIQYTVHLKFPLHAKRKLLVSRNL